MTPHEVLGGITTDFNGTVTTFAGVCKTKGWGVGQVVQNGVLALGKSVVGTAGFEPTTSTV